MLLRAYDRLPHEFQLVGRRAYRAALHNRWHCANELLPAVEAVLQGKLFLSAGLTDLDPIHIKEESPVLLSAKKLTSAHVLAQPEMENGRSPLV